jgi:hypothetical protein
MPYVGHRPVGRAQQRGGPLQPPGQQVLVRRLAERRLEPPAEVGGRQPGGGGQVGHGEPLEVASVREVLGAQQLAGYGNAGHLPIVPLTSAGLARRPRPG